MLPVPAGRVERSDRSFSLFFQPAAAAAFPGLKMCVRALLAAVPDDGRPAGRRKVLSFLSACGGARPSSFRAAVT